MLEDRESIRERRVSHYARIVSGNRLNAILKSELIDREVDITRGNMGFYIRANSLRYIWKKALLSQNN